MSARVARVIFGYILACLVAGLTLALFASPSDGLMEHVAVSANSSQGIGLFALAGAQYSAAFAAPFVLIFAIIAERHAIHSWTSNVLAAMAIAMFAVLTRYSGENAGAPSIINTYALTAFLATGFVSGTIYWFSAGRFAMRQVLEAPSVSPLALSKPQSRTHTRAQASAARGITAPFTIESKGVFLKRRRLVASVQLAPADFYAVAERIGCTPFKARKLGLVAARNAETQRSGKEVTDTERVGDWIVTNLSRNSEVLRDATGSASTYVITADAFPNLYDSASGANEFGRFFRAKNTVDAIYLSGGFDILAPWGQQQIADAGYLLVNGEEVYGNNASIFQETYEIMQ